MFMFNFLNLNNRNIYGELAIRVHCMSHTMVVTHLLFFTKLSINILCNNKKYSLNLDMKKKYDLFMTSSLKKKNT